MTGNARVVLGLSFDFHDSAAALLVDGELVAAVEEERLSRVKHDARLPVAATAAVLEIAGIDAAQVSDVVFYEKPLLVASRFLATRQRQGLLSLGPFVRDAPKVFGRNLATGYRVARMLHQLGASSPPPLRYLEHHLSHAAAAYYPSPFDEAAVLTVDGIGEWATASIGHGHRDQLRLVEELRFPDSLGLIYSLVTAWCGFTPNDDEYKVMGLAPYGEPHFLDGLRELVELRHDGSFAVDGQAVRWFSPRALRDPALAERLGGPPRPPDAQLGAREADLAASVQALVDEAMVALAARAVESTGVADLCMAGGVALNCVANGHILRSGTVERLWVQPAAGDAGSAIGAALAYWHLERREPRPARGGTDAMRGAALGPTVDRTDLHTWLAEEQIEHRVVPTDELTGTVARRLSEGAVVGWVQGRMEFGPRALGHRSLLADPRDPGVRQRLNRIVKGREDFRPFAPVVLADRAAEWFDLDHPSPYMLVVAPVRDDHRVDTPAEPSGLAERGAVARSTIPACTHVDGSARVQTVDEDHHPGLHSLLVEFDRLTGCPLLVNTSFNRAGEPIVCTAAQAVDAARAGGVDLLAIEDVLIEGAHLRG